jgi:hypothetical protein
VVVIGRSAEKTRTVAESVGADYFIADFTRLDEVRRLATGHGPHREQRPAG